jgi:hypothetical protein
MDEKSELSDKWELLAPYARAMMADLQAATFQRFGIDHTGQYEWDLDRAEITFSRKKVPFVRAHLQLVGSINRRKNTWLWGWANEGVPSQATERMSEVRRYGEEQGFEKLTMPEWSPEGNDGHDVMYVAASITGACATFHDHHGDLALYFTLDDFRLVPEDT